ncbi:hypothetical protein [Archangium lipolyticum]|uniref:hypothetical protein n=1 Tax=Archangium lipolyticum TaxID=2970465 RepID=UPI002149D88D|nr:hypothetical protein [Archangium lipolyticum]
MNRDMPSTNYWLHLMAKPKMAPTIVTLLSVFAALGLAGSAHARSDQELEFSRKQPKEEVLQFPAGPINDRMLFRACEENPDGCKFVSDENTPIWSIVQVGASLSNCVSTEPILHAVKKEVTATESNSLETTAQFEFSEFFTKLLSASVSTTYGHSWESSHTDGVESTLPVQSDHMGAFFLATPVGDVTGHYELHLSDKFPSGSPDGRTDWRIPIQGTVKAKGIAINESRRQEVIPLMRPLTESEKERCETVSGRFPNFAIGGGASPEAMRALGAVVPPRTEKTYVPADPATGAPVLNGFSF